MQRPCQLMATRRARCPHASFLPDFRAVWAGSKPRRFGIFRSAFILHRVGGMTNKNAPTPFEQTRSGLFAKFQVLSYQQSQPNKGPKTSAALAAKSIPLFMFQVCCPHHLRHCRVLSSMLDQISEDGGVFQHSSKMHRPRVVAIWLVCICARGQKLSHSFAVFRDHCCMQEIIPHGVPMGRHCAMGGATSCA